IVYAAMAPHQHQFRLHVAPMNPASNNFGSCPKADLVITSPPYANRLDYTRMWAPELNLLGGDVGFRCRFDQGSPGRYYRSSFEVAGGSPGSTTTAFRSADDQRDPKGFRTCQ